MIRIVARQIIKRECIAQYQDLARELVAASAAEEGCLAYSSNQSLDDERVHCFIEDWADREAMDRHGAAEHFKRIVPQFVALFDGEKRVEFFRVVC